MAKFHSEISDDLQRFIADQHLFFVATAPPNGRINLSPKGLDSFRVLSPREVAFMNLTGSGNETAAHLAADGRIIIMFCSFSDKPLILRLYGRGQAIYRHDVNWSKYAPLFPDSISNRNIILMAVESVQTSCGFAVPLFDFQCDRDLQAKWAESRGEAELKAYQLENNQVSIDGLLTGLLPQPTGQESA